MDFPVSAGADSTKGQGPDRGVPPGRRRVGVTKLRYAALLAAALGHLLRRAGDRPGLVITGGGEGGPATFLPPRSGREPWHAFLHALSGLEPGRASPLGPLLEEVADGMPAGGRVVILSDFLEDDEGEAVVRTAGLLRARGDEVTAIRILTPEELGEAQGEDALYTDPEDPERRIPGAPARDEGYRTRLWAYYGKLARGLAERGVDWYEVRTTDPLVPVLRSWLRESRHVPRPGSLGNPGAGR